MMCGARCSRSPVERATGVSFEALPEQLQYQAYVQQPAVPAPRRISHHQQHAGYVGYEEEVSYEPDEDEVEHKAQHPSHSMYIWDDPFGRPLDERDGDDVKKEGGVVSPAREPYRMLQPLPSPAALRAVSRLWPWGGSKTRTGAAGDLLQTLAPLGGKPHLTAQQQQQKRSKAAAPAVTQQQLQAQFQRQKMIRSEKSNNHRVKIESRPREMSLGSYTPSMSVPVPPQPAPSTHHQPAPQPRSTPPVPVPKKPSHSPQRQRTRLQVPTTPPLPAVAGLDNHVPFSTSPGYSGKVMSSQHSTRHLFPPKPASPFAFIHDNSHFLPSTGRQEERENDYLAANLGHSAGRGNDQGQHTLHRHRGSVLQHSPVRPEGSSKKMARPAAGSAGKTRRYSATQQSANPFYFAAGTCTQRLETSSIHVDADSVNS
jgi:hypothetical protein